MIRRYRVLYERNGRERCSPFFNLDNVRKALSIIRAKGYPAIIYID